MVEESALHRHSAQEAWTRKSEQPVAYQQKTTHILLLSYTIMLFLDYPEERVLSGVGKSLAMFLFVLGRVLAEVRLVCSRSTQPGIFRELRRAGEF